MSFLKHFLFFCTKKQNKTKNLKADLQQKCAFIARSLNTTQKHTGKAQKVSSENIAHLIAEFVFWLDSFTVITWSVSEQLSLRALNSPEGKCDWEQRECVRTPFSQGLSEFPLLFLSACSEVWLPAGNKTRLHHQPCTRTKSKRSQSAKTHSCGHSHTVLLDKRAFYILTKH